MRTPANGEHMIGATGMPDREKVIAAVECCFHLGEKGCQSCPYVSEVDLEHGCTVDLAGRIITVLKETEEGIPPIESTVEQKKFADRIGFAVSEFWCGACHFNLFNHPKYCPNCGKKVKWDD